MDVHSTIQAVSTFLDVGKAPVYLLLTLASLLFCFYITFRKLRVYDRQLPVPSARYATPTRSQDLPHLLSKSSTHSKGLEVLQKRHGDILHLPRASEKDDHHDWSSSRRCQELDEAFTSLNCCHIHIRKQPSPSDGASVYCQSSVGSVCPTQAVRSSEDDHIVNKCPDKINLNSDAVIITDTHVPAGDVLTDTHDNVKHMIFLQRSSPSSYQQIGSDEAATFKSSVVLARHKSATVPEHEFENVKNLVTTLCAVNSDEKGTATNDSTACVIENSESVSAKYARSVIYSNQNVPDSELTSVDKTQKIDHYSIYSDGSVLTEEPDSKFPGHSNFEFSFPRPWVTCSALLQNDGRCVSEDAHGNMARMACQSLEQNVPLDCTTDGNKDLIDCDSPDSVSAQTYNAITTHVFTDHVMSQCQDNSSPSMSYSRSSALELQCEEIHASNVFDETLSPDEDILQSSCLRNRRPDIHPSHGHTQVTEETLANGQEMEQSQLAPANTATRTDSEHILQRRRKWFKSYFLPVERSQSMQMDFMSRPLSLTVPVISHSNDSLSRRKLTTQSEIEQRLNKHTKGIFRKRVPVNNMLAWTKDPIQKPMIRTKDKSIKKEACEIFKMIQVYMGDRRGDTQGHTSVALDILCKGWSVPSLRDEVYIQLMRQTTENKRNDSLQRGWELLALCLYFFPPSPTFHPCLENYISQHQEPLSSTACVPTPEITAKCLQRLKRAQKIRTRIATHKPTLEEVEQAKTTLYSPTMFGNVLEDIMLLQRERYPDRQLPWIQTVLSEEILRLHGARTEGIFRVCGDIDEVNSLKTQCDQWTLPTDCTDPHIPASLLKLWYRELYEPLIPAEFYQACIDNYANVEAAVAIVYQLPQLNHLVLCYLIRFLQHLASPGNAAFTKMDVNNLAMVMAPNCLRYDSEDLLTIFENVQKEMGFIRTLIRYLDTSFMEGIV